MSLAFIVMQLGHVAGMFCKSQVVPPELLDEPELDVLVLDDVELDVLDELVLDVLDVLDDEEELDVLDELVLDDVEVDVLDDVDELLLDDVDELVLDDVDVLELVSPLDVPAPPIPAPPVPGLSGSSPVAQWAEKATSAGMARTSERGSRAFMDPPPRSRRSPSRTSARCP